MPIDLTSLIHINERRQAKPRKTKDGQGVARRVFPRRIMQPARKRHSDDQDIKRNVRRMRELIKLRDKIRCVSRRINKVLESVFDQAWGIIEQREKQRLIDQTKFVSAQHTSSTLIQVERERERLHSPSCKRSSPPSLDLSTCLADQQPRIWNLVFLSQYRK